MLVIRRRAGEALVVTYPDGERLEVELLEIEGSQIKLGLTAPRSVRVLRKEIAETEQANRRASQPAAAAVLDRLSAQLSGRLPASTPPLPGGPALSGGAALPGGTALAPQPAAAAAPPKLSPSNPVPTRR